MSTSISTAAASTKTAIYDAGNQVWQDGSNAEVLTKTKESLATKGSDAVTGAKTMSYSAWGMLSSMSSSLAQKVNEKLD
eukprot:CAMPEP_0116882946 /NCGR_PEP_ID=MMETSP0463-20121206/15347_1 /TAXON_ID=181622 /ORGANISM="Strombidinopsis sp, Strain SopsisLIS2011" /LENGTH=78 /DNA_ID=CAMNT_0004536977 /DNA_START=660 /DNA_END=896 /DNA_ORIENTATION=+